MESIPSATVGPLASVWPFGMETVTVTAGMPVVGGINIRNRTFEMSVDEFGIVKGKALPETLISVVEKIGTEISANMIESKTFTKAGVQSTSWYMVSAE